MAKATLTKAFEHDGKKYKIGDEFEGTEQEVETLIRQGYMKKTEEKTDEELDAPDAPDVPRASAHGDKPGIDKTQYPPRR
jgi:hypothetical protein